MRIGFSLLHYNNYEITVKAIEALRKLDNINHCEIVVVDNASPNESGKKLLSSYDKYENIHILINDCNRGFADGNNKGYNYLKNNLKCDLVCIMNSDVIIKDREFINKLYNYSLTHDIDILAPDIQGRYGPQNPLRSRPISTQKAYYMYLYNSALSFVYKIPLINYCIAYLLEYKKKQTTQIKSNVRNSRESERIEQCIPHGACIIYGKVWTNLYDFAFLPCTFLYFEEDILGDFIYHTGHSATYCSEFRVFHEEDASVDYTTSGIIQKRRFIATNMKKSIKTFMKYRKELIGDSDGHIFRI